MSEPDHRPFVGRVDHDAKGSIDLVVAKFPAGGDVDDDLARSAELSQT